ncbi:MAG: acyltransferase [Sphingomonadaceae bacterium]|nr:acyltransferase [Sphingobium sp.]MCC6482554.1 acyltransferase [Sphingomonadaceae bacterium]
MAPANATLTPLSSHNPGRSSEVDALRCFAMLSVIALHSHILPMGWIGVWLFYVISGYVVTLSVLASSKPDQSGLAGFAAFMRRRAARILPVYYGYCLIGLAVGAGLGAWQDLFSLASLALFFNNVALIGGDGRIAGWPSGHLWTLSVEMQFYMLYGLALSLLPRRLTRALLVALLLLCPAGRFVVAEVLSTSGWSLLDAAFGVYAAPLLHFDSFAFGGLLAFARLEGAGRLERLARPLFLCGMGALALYMAVYFSVNHVARDESGLDITRNVISGILIGEHRETFLYSAVALAMTGVVALAASGDRLVTPILRLAPLQWIGQISYGGYMYHAVALKVAAALLELLGIVMRHGNASAHILQFLMATAITLLLAWLSHNWLEAPLMRLFNGRADEERTSTPRMRGLEAL